MPKQNHKRRITLPKPELQLRQTLILVGVSALALLLQFSLFANRLTNVALDLPQDGPLLVERAGRLLTELLVTSFVLFLPLLFAVGVLTTFKVAGPIYRFEVFMRQILAGEKPRDCKIRKGDQLHDFCDLLNQVTEPLRTKTEEELNSEAELEGIRSLISEQGSAVVEETEADEEKLANPKSTA